MLPQGDLKHHVGLRYANPTYKAEGWIPASAGMTNNVVRGVEWGHSTPHLSIVWCQAGRHNTTLKNKV
jgi:hypothetical protein